MIDVSTCRRARRQPRPRAGSVAGLGGLCATAMLCACTIHTAPPPGAAPQGLSEHPPVTCKGNQDIALDRVSIQAPDVAVSVVGNCDVIITNS